MILPTVWDAWSAKLAVDAGFAALTVGSHPVADSIGRSDNEGMTFDELLTRVAQITAAVDVPVLVDIESGYGESPTRLIEGCCPSAPWAEHRGYGAQRRWAARSASEHADSSARYGQPPTPRACTWSSTPYRPDSSARMATVRPGGPCYRADDRSG